MTYAEYLKQTIAEIAEEMPGFGALDPVAQQSLLELADEYFHEEYIPRLEGRVNMVRYQEAMAEENEADRVYIAEQLVLLRSCAIKAQRAAYSQLLEKFAGLI